MVGEANSLTLGPASLLGLGIVIVWVGEQLTRRFALLGRSNIPAPILSGVLVAFLVLWLGETYPGMVGISGKTTNALWLWPVLPQWGLVAPGGTDVERPLLILFFTCIGLNASWQVARAGGRPLLKYLALAALLAVLQAAGGLGTALALGENPLLGVMASNVSLMGGFGTAAGFAKDFEGAGLAGAASIGIAAAAFGVVTGGIIAGLVGGRLVERSHRARRAGVGGSDETLVPANASGVTFAGEIRELVGWGGKALGHLFALLVCMKLGAFLSAFAQAQGATFPVYMGAMVVAGLLRNAHDLLGLGILRMEITDTIGSVALSWMLGVTMISLQLAQLTHAALPMLIVLSIQVVLLAALTYWVVYAVMGRDYEAAVMSAGMIGFGLGATSNALATMRVLVRRFGPAPRSFLIVPVVGAFLIDFFNALLTTTVLNVFGR